MWDETNPQPQKPVVVNSCGLKLILLGIPLLVLSLFLICGCVSLGFMSFLVSEGAKRLVNAAASYTWPTAEGKVISSTVSTGKVLVPRPQPMEQTVYQADVLYEYVVAGRTYSSSMVTFGDYSSPDPSHADSIVKKYPVGSSVTVYYSPGEPETSVLERGVTWSTVAYAVPFLLVVLLVFGVIRRWLARRSQRPA
jgi:hypothetical protein